HIADQNDPEGPLRLTVVPTVMTAGDAFNVVPARGALTCDLRADALDAFDAVLAAIPEEVDEVRLEPVLQRQWPGMDAREVTAELLVAAGERLGRPIVGADRGGASDASYFARAVPLTVDGLGPRGGGAHAPHEFVDPTSLHPRAEVALALVAALTT
ncbi:MAG: M20/M25/M40 family metallo-hydrolase, partial [Actinomycetota bacterium]|nr:M20/M25/M40 family metallo-hydrolase [Actinomycetota bacterium]